jgi:peptide deformylase
MAILPILTYPDQRLREIAQSVDKVTPEVQKLVQDMLETMNKAKGIGLAAPQVAQLIRLIVIDIRRPPEPDEDDQELTELEKKVTFPLVLINPVITKGLGKTSYEEGCLSVPGYYEEVSRYNWVQVEALDRSGKKFVLETDGLLAICVQHEMDHLEGKLFIDRISFVKSNKIKNKIKKLGYPAKKEREKIAKEHETGDFPRKHKTRVEV